MVRMKLSSAVGIWSPMYHHLFHRLILFDISDCNINKRIRSRIDPYIKKASPIERLA
jgi:hypothetical protein